MPGLYIHIPFCAHKCAYCDFYSIGSRRAPWSQFNDALIAELTSRISELSPGIDTLYMGGGTPSQMPSSELLRLMGRIRQVCGPLLNPCESTIEVNPDDVTPDYADAIARAGFNRVSMGIQSFSDVELKAVGRRHTAAQALDAYHVLTSCFDNVSIDLMFGLPGQTLASWRDTLAQAVALRPHHISAYSLMWEERTALSAMRRQGRVEEAPEHLSVSMFDALCDALSTAGYSHYEISNFALPGFRSRHNSSYWQGTPYVGLGPGAHSYDGLHTRRANCPDIAAWLQSPCSDDVFETERLTTDELREEYILTRLRTSSGISTADFARRFGHDALRRLIHRASRPLSLGTLRLLTSTASPPDDFASSTDSDSVPADNASADSVSADLTPADSVTRLVLTRSGIMTSDDIIVQLL